jgi:hypothetical protein
LFDVFWVRCEGSITKKQAKRESDMINRRIYD